MTGTHEADAPGEGLHLAPERNPLHELAGALKSRLLARAPAKPGSDAWLRRRGMIVQGRHSYGHPKVRWFEGDTAKVRIGNWCSLAGDIEIMPGGNHRVDTVTSYPIQRLFGLDGFEQAGQPWSKGDVEIGNDVWIGRGAKILGGLTVGDGAVIAAWSVVTHSVEPYTIVAGVPARPVRRRFPDHIVESLLRIRWWDWEDELVRARVKELAGTDLEAFTRRYDPELAQDALRGEELTSGPAAGG
jgi:acetyltransferase-like isoleucine patch superfamily enzyme